MLTLQLTGPLTSRHRPALRSGAASEVLIHKEIIVTNYIAILGASDPEMEAIENLLRGAGVAVVYATVDGVRVHPGNAYSPECTWHDPSDDPYEWDEIVTVECCPTTRVSTRIDHHREGDPGFGRPPSEFLTASSLGQVISWLARIGRFPRVGVGGVSTRSPGEIWQMSTDAMWCVCVASEYGAQPIDVVIPHDLVLTAAADHCLGAAYRGECYGVDPDTLLRWRVSSRARHQHRVDSERGTAKGDVSHYEVLIRERIAAARLALETAPRIPLVQVWEADHAYDHDWSRSVCDGCSWIDDLYVADMRRDTPVDELVEAATRDGVSYIAGPFVGPDGRRKFTASGPSEVIEAFMTYWAPRNGLTGIYGDPARGFAGGYEP